MNEIRESIVDEAKTWLGTRFHHMQRAKGLGVDCVQLIGGVGLNMGLLTQEQLKTVEYYSLQSQLHRSREILVETFLRLGFREVPIDDMQPGDVLGFHVVKAIAHAGILIDQGTFLHAPLMQPRKVCLAKLAGEPLHKLRKVFVYPTIIC